MDAKEIRVIVVGTGANGTIGIQTLMDHQVPIVAAVTASKAKAGMDLGEYVGYPHYGVAIENDLETAIVRTQPNVAWVASGAGIKPLRDILLVLAEHKINTVTVNMEICYRMDAYADIYDEIDDAFKANGVSVFSSGTQDVWWSGIGLDMIGTCKKVTAIHTEAVLPMQGQGIDNLKEFRITEDPEAFRKEMEGVDMANEPDTSFIAPLMSLLVNAQVLGLHPISKSVKLEPIPAKEDFDMAEWNVIIKKGTMIGQKQVYRVETAEGIPLTFDMVIKCLEDGDIAGTTWDIQGTPNLRCELGDVGGDITTAAPAINRIPQVIAARPGIVTQADLQERPVYRHGAWKLV